MLLSCELWIETAVLCWTCLSWPKDSVGLYSGQLYLIQPVRLTSYFVLKCSVLFYKSVFMALLNRNGFSERSVNGSELHCWTFLSLKWKRITAGERSLLSKVINTNVQKYSSRAFHLSGFVWQFRICCGESRTGLAQFAFSSEGVKGSTGHWRTNALCLRAW